MFPYQNTKILLLIRLICVSCIFTTHHLVAGSNEDDYNDNDQQQDLQDRHHKRTVELKSHLKCHDIPLLEDRLPYGDYWLLKNFIRGRRSINMGCSESITYTTIGDYTFMDSLGAVVSR